MVRAQAATRLRPRTMEAGVQCEMGPYNAGGPKRRPRGEPGPIAESTGCR